MTYFAAALASTDDGWTGRELDLDGLEDLDAVADALRDLAGDHDGPALLLLEEDDEYLAVVRVQGGGSLAAPRVFLSDSRAADSHPLAALLWEEGAQADEIDDEESDDDEDEGTRALAEPVGDTALLADLGVPDRALLDLCAEEGLLPADVMVAVGERVGFADVLDELRPV